MFASGAEHPVYDALGPQLAATCEPPYGWGRARARFRPGSSAISRQRSSAGWSARSWPAIAASRRGSTSTAAGCAWRSKPPARNRRAMERACQAAGSQARTPGSRRWRSQLPFGYRSLAELRHAFPGCAGRTGAPGARDAVPGPLLVGDPHGTDTNAAVGCAWRKHDLTGCSTTWSVTATRAGAPTDFDSGRIDCDCSSVAPRRQAGLVGVH